MAHTSDWIDITKELPVTGIILDTKIHTESMYREEYGVIYRDGTWSFSDGCIDLDYEPTHWRICRIYS